MAEATIQDWRAERERLNELRTIIASTRTYEAIARELLRRQPTGLHSVYNESTDTVAHLFMPFRPPQRDHVDARRFAAFGGTVDAAYREAEEPEMLDMDSVHISSEVFFDVFPFHIVFNRALVIRNVGSGLAAVMPDLIGQSLDEIFQLTRPMAEFTLENVGGNQSKNQSIGLHR